MDGLSALCWYASLRFVFLQPDSFNRAATPGLAEQDTGIDRVAAISQSVIGGFSYYVSGRAVARCLLLKLVYISRSSEI